MNLISAPEIAARVRLLSNRFPGVSLKHDLDDPALVERRLGRSASRRRATQLA